MQLPMLLAVPAPAEVMVQGLQQEATLQPPSAVVAGTMMLAMVAAVAGQGWAPRLSLRRALPSWQPPRTLWPPC